MKLNYLVATVILLFLVSITLNVTSNFKLNQMYNINKRIESSNYDLRCKIDSYEYKYGKL